MFGEPDDSDHYEETVLDNEPSDRELDDQQRADFDDPYEPPQSNV